MDSILTSVKKYLGIVESYTVFDPDLIAHINSVLGMLMVMGIGPEAGYQITGSTEKWTDYLGEVSYRGLVETFVTHRVRLIWDPPINSGVSKALEDELNRVEFMLMMAANSEGCDVDEV